MRPQQQTRGAGSDTCVGIQRAREGLGAAESAEAGEALVREQPSPRICQGTGCVIVFRGHVWTWWERDLVRCGLLGPCCTGLIGRVRKTQHEEAGNATSGCPRVEGGAAKGLAGVLGTSRTSRNPREAPPQAVCNWQPDLPGGSS